MSAIVQLRWIIKWIANTLATSPTGLYAVAEYAAPWAELQASRTAAPGHVQYFKEGL